MNAALTRWGMARFVMGLAAACVAAAAAAAPVEVRVAAADGKALPGAVVFLEPRDGKPPPLPTSQVEIAQVDRRFVPEVSVVTVGSSVNFPNRDTVRHHVYSFSPTKKFEIKLYVGSPTAPVVFDKPGIAVLGCNIHDNMAAWVVVVDTPWWARSGADGRVSWPNVPAGRYKLRVWHAALPVGAAPSEQDLRVDQAAVQVHVALAALAGLSP